MQANELIIYIKNLVTDAVALKNQYTDLHDIPVNYACVFAHSETEYAELYKLALLMGTKIKGTEMGDLFHIEPFETIAGQLQLIKIRKPDPQKTERGYADFTVPDYQSFRAKYLHLPHFKLSQRADYEMLGLRDPQFSVLVYFAYPPMDVQLGLI